MCANVCREHHVAQLSHKNVQRLFLTRQELLSMVSVERLLRAHALEQRRKPLSVLEGGIVRLKRSGATGLHRIAGIKDCGTHMELLTEDNDTPVPMALASNTNPFASDELYQQSGEYELAQLARARLPGRLDPPLKQVAKQVWRITVGKGWGTDFEGGCRVKGAEGLYNDLCNPVNIAQTLLTLDRAIVFHTAEPLLQPAAAPTAAAHGLAVAAAFPPGFVKPHSQAPAFSAAPAVAGVSHVQEPGLAQPLGQGLPLPVWIQAALQHHQQQQQQQPHQPGSIPGFAAMPPLDALAVPAQPSSVTVTHHYGVAGTSPGAGLASTGMASHRGSQPGTTHVAFQRSGPGALRDPRLASQQQATAPLAGVATTAPGQALQPAAAAVAMSCLPEALLRQLSATVALQQVQRECQGPLPIPQQPSPVAVAGWHQAGGPGSHPTARAEHTDEYVANSAAVPAARGSLLEPSTATVATSAARVEASTRAPTRTSNASTAGQRRAPPAAAEHRESKRSMRPVSSWAVDLFKKAVLSRLARQPGSDTEERTITMSALAGEMKSLSVGSGREWTAAQEGLSFKEFCHEVVDRRVPGRGLRMEYTEPPDGGSLEWVLVLPPGVEARMTNQRRAGGTGAQQQPQERQPPSPPPPSQQQQPPQQQQEEERRRGVRGGRRQRRAREPDSDRGGSRDGGVLEEARDRRDISREGRHAKAQRSSGEGLH